MAINKQALSWMQQQKPKAQAVPQRTALQVAPTAFGAPTKVSPESVGLDKHNYDKSVGNTWDYRNQKNNITEIYDDMVTPTGVSSIDIDKTLGDTATNVGGAYDNAAIPTNTSSIDTNKLLEDTANKATSGYSNIDVSGAIKNAAGNVSSAYSNFDPAASVNQAAAQQQQLWDTSAIDKLYNDMLAAADANWKTRENDINSYAAYSQRGASSNASKMGSLGAARNAFGAQAGLDTQNYLNKQRSDWETNKMGIMQNQANTTANWLTNRNQQVGGTYGQLPGLQANWEGAKAGALSNIYGQEPGLTTNVGLASANTAANIYGKAPEMEMTKAKTADEMLYNQAMAKAGATADVYKQEPGLTFDQGRWSDQMAWDKEKGRTGALVGASTGSGDKDWQLALTKLQHAQDLEKMKAGSELDAKISQLDAQEALRKQQKNGQVGKIKRINGKDVYEIGWTNEDGTTGGENLSKQEVDTIINKSVSQETLDYLGDDADLYLEDLERAYAQFIQDNKGRRPDPDEANKIANDLLRKYKGGR